MDLAADFSGALVPVGNAGTASANSLWLSWPARPLHGHRRDHEHPVDAAERGWK